MNFDSIKIGKVTHLRFRILPTKMLRSTTKGFVHVKIYYRYNAMFSPSKVKKLLKEFNISKERYNGQWSTDIDAIISVKDRNGQNVFYKYEAPKVPGFGGKIQSEIVVSVIPDN